MGGMPGGFPQPGMGMPGMGGMPGGPMAGMMGPVTPASTCLYLENLATLQVRQTIHPSVSRRAALLPARPLPPLNQQRLPDWADVLVPSTPHRSISSVRHRLCAPCDPDAPTPNGVQRREA